MGGPYKRCGSHSPVMQTCIKKIHHTGDHASHSGRTWSNINPAILAVAEPLWRVIVDHVPVISEIIDKTICFQDGADWPCQVVQDCVMGTSVHLFPPTIQERYITLRKRLRDQVSDPGTGWVHEWAGEQRSLYVAARGGYGGRA